MNYVDINKKYTATVAEYMAKGYTINTRTMSGSQGDYAHIDLTDGTEVIRIMVDTFHEWTDISLDGLEIIVGRADSEVTPKPSGIPVSISSAGSGSTKSARTAAMGSSTGRWRKPPPPSS